MEFDRKNIALIMTSISIVLLLIYGFDAFAESMNEGILHIDAKTRGIALGTPTVILPIVSYIITRKISFHVLGILILINGVLIVLGTTIFIGIETPQDSIGTMLEERLRSFGPVLATGVAILFLGIWKVIKSGNK